MVQSWYLTSPTNSFAIFAPSFSPALANFLQPSQKVCGIIAERDNCTSLSRPPLQTGVTLAFQKGTSV